MTQNPIKMTGTGKITNRNMNPALVKRFLDLGYIIDENGKLVKP